MQRPFFGGGGFAGGTINGNVVITGTLDVTGVATFTTTVTGSGNIMAGAAFALGFTGRAQFKSSVDGRAELYAADGSTFGILRVGAGTAAVNALSMNSDVRTGFFSPGAGLIGVSPFGVEYWRFTEAGAVPGLIQTSAGVQRWTNGTITGTVDLSTYRVGAGILGVSGGTGTTGAGGFQPAQSANGATIQILSVSENLTLSTSGTTTDTTANLLVAGSIVLTVVARVTTTITTATDWAVGDPTTALRFIPANATMTAGTTDIGRTHITTGIASATTGVYQSANAKVRVTTTGTPGAGAIRLTSFYFLLTPPTS